jgi:hypothetical protein
VSVHENRLIDGQNNVCRDCALVLNKVNMSAYDSVPPLQGVLIRIVLSSLRSIVVMVMMVIVLFDVHSPK